MSRGTGVQLFIHSTLVTVKLNLMFQHWNGQQFISHISTEQRNESCHTVFHFVSLFHTNVEYHERDF